MAIYIYSKTNEWVARDLLSLRMRSSSYIKKSRNSRMRDSIFLPNDICGRLSSKFNIIFFWAPQSDTKNPPMKHFMFLKQFIRRGFLRDVTAARTWLYRFPPRNMMHAFVPNSTPPPRLSGPLFTLPHRCGQRVLLPNALDGNLETSEWSREAEGRSVRFCLYFFRKIKMK